MSLEPDRQAIYRRLLEEVRKELAAKKVETDRLRAELADLQDQERQLSALCGERTASKRKQPSDSMIDPGKVTTPDTSGVEPGGNFSSEVRRVARAAIAAAGRPMNRAEILHAVRDAGIPLPSRHPEKKVSKILWADKKLRNERGEGYALVDS